MKFKAKLRILDRANELMNKQVWAATQVADRLSMDCTTATSLHVR